MPKLARPKYRDKKTGELRQSKCYFARIRDADGVRRWKRLSPNLAAARVMLSTLLAGIERDKADPAGPAAARAARRPLHEHVDDWAGELAAGGASPNHARQMASACRSVFAGCGFVTLADVSESAVRRSTADARRPTLVAEVPPPASPAGYTKAELADALGVSK